MKLSTVLNHRIATFAAAAALGIASLAGSAAAADRPDIVIDDFEGPDYGAWKATGDAFGPGPVCGALAGQMSVSGFEGKGLVNTFFHADGSTGTLTSPPFKIDRKFIAFLIGGGNDAENLGIRLLVEGKAVRKATGADNENLEWTTWSTADLQGKTATLEIFDTATGGWGHINIDQIIETDTKRGEPAVPASLYHEKYRPQFHFTAAKNWLNDPNGLVYYAGEYHMFFQHNPSGIGWGNMTWGHAVSTDLVHWEQLPHAIRPDKLGTIFSGSAVVDVNNTAGFQTGDEKVIVCMFTSAGNPFTQSIAYSNDKGRTFTKYEHNPVLKNLANGNRDPKLIWHEPSKKWIVALYLDGNRYALFSSPNLKEWEKLQEFNFPGTGECPDFFPMPVDGDAAKTKWLYWGAAGKYLIGSFDGQSFKPEQPVQNVEHGANCYAAQTYSGIPESDGRRIQIAWMQGGKYPAMPFNQQMTFPRELTLHSTPDGIRLYVLPAREIEKLHDKEHTFKNLAVEPAPGNGAENPLAAVTGDLFDIAAEIDPGGASDITFTALGHAITCNIPHKTISALGKSAPLPIVDGKIQLRILVDRTSIEIYAGGGAVTMSSCMLPKDGAAPLTLNAAGGKATLTQLTVWQLKSAWPAAPAEAK